LKTIVRDQLLDDACEGTGLDDFGDVPYLDALDVLVDSYNHDVDLAEPVGDAFAAMLTGILVKRLQLVDDRARHPEMADEQVIAPIFIVGQPRSGSTHLHALLACVDGVRSPRFWEMQQPSPPPEGATYTTDPRIAAMEAAIEQMPAEMLVRHPLSATRPEQCNSLFDWAFVNQAWMANYDIRTYKDWFFDADYAPMYTAHHRTLQHLQWKVPGRWVLKYPKHLLSLDALLAEYPDAVLLWTHRDPAKVVPSVISLTSYMRQSNDPGLDLVRFGREWVVIEEMALLRGLATRDRDADPSRHVDVIYDDLMRDPIATVESVCERVGVDFGDDSRRAVQRWLDDHPQDKHGVHRYSPEDFGLTADHLRTRFDFYIQRFL
jgi:Sulfotransferase family